ncbi:MAG: ankyrin repeat domain-containing protein [Tahibacter sp.]
MGPLHAAVYNVDEDRVRQLLTEGSDPNERDEAGFVPLHWAALRGAAGDMQPIVRLLVDAGADMNVLASTGTDSVLSWAVESGSVAMVVLLIRCGVDVNLPASGVTPLMRAGATGNVIIVNLLLQHGADPNTRCGSFNAADYASHYGYAELASELLRIQHAV